MMEDNNYTPSSVSSIGQISTYSISYSGCAKKQLTSQRARRHHGKTMNNRQLDTTTQPL